jgi:hypothetical protein
MVTDHVLSYTDDTVTCSCGWSDGPYNAAPHWLKALGEWHVAYPEKKRRRAA